MISCAAMVPEMIFPAPTVAIWLSTSVPTVIVAALTD
jgi:hypothetical protein